MSLRPGIPQSPLANKTSTPPSPLAHKFPLPQSPLAHRSPGPLRSPAPHKSPAARGRLDESPVIPKRRKLDIFMTAALNTTYPSPYRSTVSSPSDSPNPVWTPEHRHHVDGADGSYLSTPAESPDLTRSGKKYKKDELWMAIKPAYQSLMKGDIMEACKTTEGDLSWDDDDETINTKSVSFAEFLQQYTELMDWCRHLQAATHSGHKSELHQGLSLSEKYLNQTYHEEMLKHSPRKKFLTAYAKELLRRYPHMNDEINARLQHLNNTWEDLMCVVSPDREMGGEEKMRRDLEHDLSELRAWLNDVERRLLSLSFERDWTIEVLEQKLLDHKAFQRDIESHIKIVSAVLKLCERIEKTEGETKNQLVALDLEKRWHVIWLRSLEWQCRLEDAISQRKSGGAGWNIGYPFGAPSLSRIDLSFDHTISDTYDDYDDDEDRDPASDVEAESDTNRDILPFSEDEYEKIPLDVDTQTDYSGDTDTAGHREEAALGKVPHNSENEENKAITDNDDCEEIDSVSELDAAATMRRSVSSRGELSEVEEVDEARVGKDVGYGSESHSNDEVDSPRKSKSRSESAQTEAVHLSSCESQTGDPAWKNSATNACDSSGDVRMERSDVRMERSDVRIERNVRRQDVSSDDASVPHMDISASPGQKFYQFAIIDSEPDRLRLSDNELLTRLQSTPIKHSCPSPGSRLDILITELEYVEQAVDCYQKDSPLSRLSTSEHIVRTEFKQKWSNGRSIQQLISRAEAMVDTKWRNRRNGRKTTESSAIDDSCDASSEFTESEVEYSSAISDTEYPHPCLYSSPRLDLSEQTLVGSPQSPQTTPDPASAQGAALRPRQNSSSRKRDRPRSMQEVPDVETVEVRTYSISESAIADLREMHGTPPKGRRSQRTRARSKMQRSRSDSERLETNAGLSTNSSSDRTVNASGDNLLNATSSADNVLDSDHVTVEVIGASDLVRHHNFEDSISTVESFSETAWDDYQESMYTSVNDSCLEEKLDDTHLQWEASSNLEFDDDFLQTVDADDSYKPLTVAQVGQGASADDSDSDLEEIQHVLHESRRQLLVADTVLKKPRQDAMKTGIFLHPHKYAEVLATCETNIRCLEDVCETLGQTDGTQHSNFIMFKDMISLWGEDYTLARERQHQSKELSCMYTTLQTVRATIQETEVLLDSHDTFDDTQQLEEYIQRLQERRSTVSARQTALAQLVCRVECFRLKHKSIPMDKFSHDTNMAAVQCRILSERLTTTLSAVQVRLSDIYNYNETYRELTYCLEKENATLCGLELRLTGTDLTSADKARIHDDLQTMLCGLTLYEEKLTVLRRLAPDVIDSSDDHQREHIFAQVTILTNQLLSIRKRCQDNLALCCITPLTVETVAMTTSVATQTPKVNRPTTKRTRYMALKCLLRLALPLQCGLLILYGLLCLGRDFVFSPQLHYVRGPPPF